MAQIEKTAKLIQLSDTELTIANLDYGEEGVRREVP